MTIQELEIRRDIIKAVTGKFQYDITRLNDEITAKCAERAAIRKWQDHFHQEASDLDRAIEQHPDNTSKKK